MRQRLALAALTLGIAAASGCSKKPAPAPVAPPSAAPAATPQTPQPPAEAPGVAPVAAAGVALAADAGTAVDVATAPEADAGGAPAPIVHTPPPKASLTRAAGPVAPTVLEDRTVAPTAVTVRDGATYVALDVAGLTREQWSWDTRTFVGGGRSGMAVLDPASDRVLVRLVGEEPLASFGLDLAAGPARGGSHIVWPWTSVQVTVTGEPQKAADLDTAFFTALEASLRASGASGDPFWSFVAQRALLLAARGDLKSPALAELRAQRGGGDIAEMANLFTGMTSIEEALQADRGLRVRGATADTRTVPLADVAPVPLAAHDWDKLLEGKAFVIEPLAASVPADALYLHFHDLRMAVRLGRELDEWLTPVLPMIEWRAGPSHLVDRYEAQLVVERSALSEALGNLAADGVALVVGDPFVREGTDISVLFKIKEETLLLASLGTYEAKARANHPDLAETTYEVGALSVRRLSTPDRQVDQHRVKLGDVLVISNSRAAIERFAAVADGREPSLAKSGDFKYFRAKYPFDKGAEDGFVFASDAFVAKAVSPRTRILESRRMEALADLRAVNHAALMAAWLDGKPTAEASELVQRGWLSDEELKHSDGRAITLDQKQGARSEWGDSRFVTPLAELPLTTVSEAEKAAYDAFRTQYQDYWRRFVDPIGVRIDLDVPSRRLAFDMTIMPLISGTKYDELAELSGGARFKPGVAPGTMQWTFAVGKESGLRRELDGVTRFLAGKLEFSWIGELAFIGVADTMAATDLALLTESVPTAAERERGSEADWAAALDQAPLYAGVEVSNPLAFAATMTAVRALAESTVPGVVTWSEGGKFRDVAITKVTAKVDGFVRNARSVDFEYALANGIFVLSMERAALERVIDGILDGTGPVALPADKATGGAQAQFATSPDTGGLAAATLLLLEDGAVRQWSKAHRAAELLQRAFGVTTAEERRSLGLAYLGYDPVVLQGGDFEPSRSGLKHSLYGSPTAPTLPEVPVAGSPVSRLLGALRSLSLDLGIEGSGADEALHVRGAWTRSE